MTDHGGELLRFIELEQIDGDIYRGWPGVWPKERRAIFGGEVAAQALRAASHSVPADRVPHSLHGYFRRRGDPTMPVVFVVDRDRDGRSFSARRVAAMQRGEVIWEMSCSFHVTEPGPEFVQPVRPGLVAPLESPEQLPRWSPLVEVRVPPRPDGGDSPPAGSSDRVWTRVSAPLPDDWVIYDCVPAKVGGRRGLYTGTAHDLDGNLVAMLAQETLLRPPPE